MSKVTDDEARRIIDFFATRMKEIVWENAQKRATEIFEDIRRDIENPGSKTKSFDVTYKITFTIKDARELLSELRKKAV